MIKKLESTHQDLQNTANLKAALNSTMSNYSTTSKLNHSSYFSNPGHQVKSSSKGGEAPL